jgi:hypothetical protein
MRVIIGVEMTSLLTAGLPDVAVTADADVAGAPYLSLNETVSVAISP